MVIWAVLMLIQNIKGYKDLFKSKEEKKLKFVKAFEKLLNDPNTAQFSDGFLKLWCIL